MELSDSVSHQFHSYQVIKELDHGALSHGRENFRSAPTRELEAAHRVDGVDTELVSGTTTHQVSSRFSAFEGHCGISPSRIEFALKLGYGKEEIDRVMRKLRDDADEDTFLHELVKIGARNSLMVAKTCGRPPSRQSSVPADSSRQGVRGRDDLETRVCINLAPVDRVEDKFTEEGNVRQKVCPYRRRCTYGAKCRFRHPEEAVVRRSQK